MILSSKLRSTIAIAVAASSVAVSSVAITPVANAKPISPAKTSGGVKHLGMESCQNDKDRYNQLVNAGEDLLLNNKPGAQDAFGAAEHIRNTDKAGGCSWAQ
jgi:hypothetical protein